MTTRTTQSNVQFLSAFRLPGFAQAQPPGTYRVTTDEEELHGLSFVTYRTTLASLQVPALGIVSNCISHVPISLDDLEACVRDDRLTACT